MTFQQETTEDDPHTAFVRQQYRDLMMQVKSGTITEEEGADNCLRTHLLLEKRADHDGLTGLLNQRAFALNLKKEVELSERKQDWNKVLMRIDVDKFKRVNDIHGHQTGNLVLMAISEALTARLRKTDVVGRVGGDEFAIILTGIDEHNARVLAEELRNLVRERVKEAYQPIISQEISLGIVQFKKGLKEEELDKIADGEAYKEKRAKKKAEKGLLNRLGGLPGRSRLRELLSGLPFLQNNSK